MKSSAGSLMSHNIIYILLHPHVSIKIKSLLEISLDSMVKYYNSIPFRV